MSSKRIFPRRSRRSPALSERLLGAAAALLMAVVLIAPASPRRILAADEAVLPSSAGPVYKSVTPDTAGPDEYTVRRTVVQPGQGRGAMPPSPAPGEPVAPSASGQTQSGQTQSGQTQSGQTSPAAKPETPPPPLVLPEPSGNGQPAGSQAAPAKPEAAKPEAKPEAAKPEPPLQREPASGKASSEKSSAKAPSGKASSGQTPAAKAAPAAKAEKAPAAPPRRATITTGRQGNTFQVRLNTDGPVQFTYFEMKNPPRLVVDLLGNWTVDGLRDRTFGQAGKGVEGCLGMRLGQHPDRLRAVFDLDPARPPKAELSKSDEGVLIRFRN
ncbi:localization of periplasmic protein complex [Desulfovibrio sp. X2]|uniref:AMIN domain-containing protein n=1 Tax=Desulfovibrio sp. X2 TaxID=941449 RepID=UPI000358DE66|nr:AMIN domain-containing protein [Desulfovibrio sp. X2]EPR43109.1 localization of periplasmic protein complex [Desulfovibrio sp. X2]